MTPLEQTTVKYKIVGLSNNNKVRVGVESSTTADGYSVTETGIVLYNSNGTPALELLLENVGGDIKNGKDANTHYSANIADNGSGVYVHGYAKISDGTIEYVKYTYNLYFTLEDVTHAPASGISQPITIMPLVYKKAMHFTGLTNAFYRPALYSIYAENAATVENSKTISIYSDGSNLTDYSFEGQCSQASTPTPSSPVEVECFGDLIASGDNAGKYDIPITSGGVTEHIILSESLCKKDNYADSLKSEGAVTRKIKKLVFDGTEGWTNAGISGLSRMSIALSDAALVRDSICSHYIYDPDNLNVNNHCFITSTLDTFMFCDNANANSLSNWTTFLATQYANGTPVTVYYVLATPTTESVIAPTIPTSSGFSNITIGTSLAPSKFTYDLGKMFVAKGQGKVRQNGEWV